jgi:RND family efflux transporter MFP subunit
MTGKTPLDACLLACCAVACVLALAGCNTNSPGSQATGKDPATPVRVETMLPKRQDLKRTSEATPAELMPYEQTDLYAKIPGFVRKVNVDIGDEVAAPKYDNKGNLMEGMVLAELWVPEMEEELKQKQALVAQAQADVKQAEATFAAAKANVKTAEALVKEAEAGRDRADALAARWKSEFQRLERASRTSIDQQQLEETRYQLKAAEAARLEVDAKVQSMQAARDESAAKRDKADADILAAQARQGVAEAARDLEKAMMQYTRVIAPYRGVVTKRNVHTGAFITAKNGEPPLLTVVRTDKLRVLVDVSEKDLRFLHKNDIVQVQLDALPGESFQWKITRFAPVLGSGKKVRAEVDLDNPTGKFFPGMYGKAAVVLEDKPNALTVPVATLASDAKGSFVWLVVEGKAKKQYVTLGINTGKEAEVTKGLTDKDKIVIATKQALRDGMAVETQRAAPSN